MDKILNKEDGKNLISWSISRSDKREHGTIFYVVLLSFMAFLLLFSVWQKDVLFGIFVIMAVGTIFFISSQTSQIDKFLINDDGIKINKELEYLYDQFKYFDIYKFSDDDYEIFFILNGKLKSTLRIRIWKRDFDKILSVLSEKIQRKKIEPSFLDIMSKLIGI